MRVPRRKNRRGAVEVMLITALLAIGTVATATLFGDNVRKLFGASADALAGQQQVANRAQKSGRTIERRTLKNFGDLAAYHGGPGHLGPMNRQSAGFGGMVGRATPQP